MSAPHPSSEERQQPVALTEPSHEEQQRADTTAEREEEGHGQLFDEAVESGMEEGAGGGGGGGSPLPHSGEGGGGAGETSETSQQRQYVDRVVGSLIYYRPVADFSLLVSEEDTQRIFDFTNCKFADQSSSGGHLQDSHSHGGAQPASSSRTVAGTLRLLLQQSGKMPPHIHLKFKDQFVRNVNSLLTSVSENSGGPVKKKSKKGFTDMDFYKIAFCHEGCPTKLYIGATCSALLHSLDVVRVGLFRDYIPGHPFPLQVVIKGACIHQSSIPLSNGDARRTHRLRSKRKASRRNIQQTMVGVVGSEDCDERLYDIALQVGSLLAKSGCCVVTDGRHGVMEAASKGGKDAGGHTLAILATDNRHHANPFVDYAIATGMGTAAQSILCNTCSAVIAIGGNLDTLAEVSLALFKDKPLACIESWAFDTRMRQAATAEEAVEYVLSQLR